MGGTVWAESRAGVGSTFHFTMLLPPAQPGLASTSSGASGLSSGDAGSGRSHSNSNGNGDGGGRHAIGGSVPAGGFASGAANGFRLSHVAAPSCSGSDTSSAGHELCGNGAGGGAGSRSSGSQSSSLNMSGVGSNGGGAGAAMSSALSAGSSVSGSSNGDEPSRMLINAFNKLGCVLYERSHQQQQPVCAASG